MTAPVVATAARAVAPRAAARAGAGKVIDVTPVESKPLRARNVRTRDRAGDVAKGAGLGSLLPDLPGGGGKSRGSGSGSSAKKLLIAEFILCMVILGFSPLAKKSKGDTPAGFMKRGSAIMGCFFILGLLTTAGRGPARAAAAFGGLITLVLLISSRSIFSVLAGKLAPGVGETDDQDAEDLDWDDAGEGVADAIGDVIDEVQQRNEPLPMRPIGGAGIR